MAKQKRQHPELPVADYLLAPLALGRPDAMVAQGDRRRALPRAGGKILRAAVKTTEDGQENNLISLHHMDAPAVRRCLRGATLLLGKLQELLG